MCREHKEWVDLERARKKKITELVTKTLLDGVFYCKQDFTHIRVSDIIAYLFVEYGEVEYQDLVGDRSRLAEPLDANLLFQELVQHVQ